MEWTCLDRWIFLQAGFFHKIKVGRKKMIKEYISTPQALALAVMVFTLGLKIPVRDETALNVITILWFISMVVLWALM